MEDLGLIPVKDVQKMLKVSKATLWNWIQQKKLSAVKLSPRKVYIRKEELERFLKSSETSAEHPTIDA